MAISYRRVTLDLGIPTRTLKRAMARLHAASLLDRWCTHVVQHDGFTSNLIVQVWGTYGTGERSTWVPLAAIRWCDAQPGWGGIRAQQGGKMAPMARIDADSGDQEQGVTEQDGPSMNSLLPVESVSFSNEKEVGSEAAPSPFRVVDPHTVPRYALGHTKLTGDPDDPDHRVKAKVRHAWMTTLVNAYNAAYRKAGVSTFLTLPGKRQEVEFATYDPNTGKTTEPSTITGKVKGAHLPALERWKNFLPLLEAGRKLVDRNIAPQAWAEWAVARCQNKLLPIRQIFIAGHIDSNTHRAIFRKESGYGYGEGSTAFVPQPAHYEQLYRTQEASRRRRGITHFFGFPPAYVALRKQEIDAGIVDPLTRYPATPRLIAR